MRTGLMCAPGYEHIVGGTPSVFGATTSIYMYDGPQLVMSVFVCGRGAVT